MGIFYTKQGGVDVRSSRYDVVIIGGGPAGLSVGSELSKKLKVLVVEKGKVGETTKSWFVPKDIIEKNKDIIKFTYGGVSRFLTNTFASAPLEWESKLFDHYPYIKEKEILQYWKDVILENGSDVMENSSYKDHVVEDNYVRLETSKGRFECKLVLDASGSDSVISKKYEIESKQYYWWSVCGCIGKHPEGIKDLKVGDYMLWQTFEDTNLNHDASLREGRPVFEYEIMDEETSFTLILYLRKDKMPLDFMKKEFEHIIRNETATKNFHDIEIKEYKYGWYPSGGVPGKLARDRIDFIGDAGCWTTPCGWGMGFILNSYKEYSKNLIKLIKEDKLDQNNLFALADNLPYDKSQILLNQIITHFLSNASVTQLDHFIDIFRAVDPIICEKMFTLKISPRELREVLDVVMKGFNLEDLIKMVFKEDSNIVFGLIKNSLMTYIKNHAYRVLRYKKSFMMRQESC